MASYAVFGQMKPALLSAGISMVSGQWSKPKVDEYAKCLLVLSLAGVRPFFGNINIHNMASLQRPVSLRNRL